MIVERRRLEILVTVDTAEAALERGEGCILCQETIRELAGGVKQRGRARLSNEQQDSH
jgi:hypothetical protein